MQDDVLREKEEKGDESKEKQFLETIGKALPGMSELEKEGRA